MEAKPGAKEELALRPDLVRVLVMPPDGLTVVSPTPHVVLSDVPGLPGVWFLDLTTCRLDRRN